jgi:hypothetical protein
LRLELFFLFTAHLYVYVCRVIFSVWFHVFHFLFFLSSSDYDSQIHSSLLCSTQGNIKTGRFVCLTAPSLYARLILPLLFFYSVISTSIILLLVPEILPT